MKRAFVIATIATVVSFGAFAQEPSETRSKIALGDGFVTVFNGKQWKQMDQERRAVYVMGIEDGLVLALLDAKKRETGEVQEAMWKANERFHVAGFTYGDEVQQVNRFYSDSANLRIPVVEAYAYVILKFKGESSATLDEQVSALRKRYNDQTSAE